MFLLACVHPGEGVSVWRGLPDRTPLQDRDPHGQRPPSCMAKGGRYVSYWNVLLFSKNLRLANKKYHHNTVCHYVKSGFPLGLEKWAGIFLSLEITQNTGKLREIQTNVIYYFR